MLTSLPRFVKKSIAGLTMVSFIFGSMLPAAPVYADDSAGGQATVSSAASTVTRLAGGSRYETAVQISGKNWLESYNAVLTRGDTFPDALAGAVLANSSTAGGPLLLTEPKRLLPEVLSELKRLRTTTVFILGGTGAVSQDVEKELNDNGIETRRIQGGNRYETAANIALAAVPSSEKAFLASGNAFADALSISSYAAASKTPLLLSDTKTIPQATLDALKQLGVKEVTLIGGESAISAAAFDQLAEAGYTVNRLSGGDRYKTNTAILNSLPFNTSKIIAATGTAFPDALAGSVLAARENNPIVLVPQDENALLNSDTATYLGAIRAGVSAFYILGGTAAINSKTENVIRYGRIFNRTSLQFWDGYALKSEYERLLAFVPEPLTDYIDILVPNFVGEVQADGNFAYRFSTSEIPAYIVSLGQSKGAKVVPMVMLNGKSASNMLKNPIGRTAFVDSAAKVIAETNADGIMVDFELLDDDCEAGITGLMAELYARLHPQGKLVMAAVMSKTSDTKEWWYNEFNYHDIAQYADFVQVMTYDYSTSAPGPIAPLDWVRKVMAYSVSKMPSEKILLGIPYYGKAWKKSGNGYSAKALGWAGMTGNAAEYGAEITRRYGMEKAVNPTPADPVGVPYVEYNDALDGSYRYAYFDDPLSWGAKFDLVEEFNLGGIGAWSMRWINEISSPVIYPLVKERIKS